MTKQRDRMFSALHTLRSLPAPSSDVLTRRYEVRKLEFLVLAEQAAILLRPTAPGAYWTFDGYKSDSLFLRALYQPLWLSEREVIFRLEFRPRDTTVGVRSSVPEIVELYQRYVAAIDRLRLEPR
ncbi:hypothetical protein [Deinococcus sp.]|uniref:hypothetical protein n=1 Tax=Deinococcus sp. TaxID=47478 RepID=UPI0025D5A7B6|nr:hypothetical protein [Deinococcus sp.]